jgi:hypothetical protein
MGCEITADAEDTGRQESTTGFLPLDGSIGSFIDAVAGSVDQLDNLEDYAPENRIHITEPAACRPCAIHHFRLRSNPSGQPIPLRPTCFP